MSYHRYCPICKIEIFATCRSTDPESIDTCKNGHKVKRNTTLTLEQCNKALDALKSVGQKAVDISEKTGATKTAIDLGLTHLFGPLGKQVGDSLDIHNKVNKGIENKFDSWFDDLDAKQQEKYAEEHEDSDVVKEAKRRGKFKHKESEEIEPSVKEIETPKEEKPLYVKPKAEDNDDIRSPKIRELKKRKQEKVEKVKPKSRHEYRKGTIRGVPSIASVDNETLRNAFKALYLIMYYSTEGSTQLPQSIKSQSEKVWEPALVEFLNDAKVPKLAIQKLMKSAYKHEPFTQSQDDLLIKAGSALNSKKSTFEKDISISKTELGLIKAFISYFKRNSETALNYLEKHLSTVKEPNLNLMFAKTFNKSEDFDHSAQSNKKLQLEKLVKGLTGRKDTKLTLDEAKNLRENDPEKLKLYNALRREMNSVYKNWVTDYVRKSGKDKVDYQKLLKELNKTGLEHALPENFVGYIDDHLNYYTTAGNLIDGKPVGEIKMNPNYDADSDNAYVFKLKTPMGESTYYTVNYKSTNVNKKFDTVNNMEDNIASIRAKWLKALKSGNAKERLMATQLELMYKFGARSGRSGNETAGEPTYGITTLLTDHISKVGNGLKIKYKGKKGAEQIHLLTGITPNDRLLIKILLAQLEGKKKGMPVWTIKDKELQASSTLRYLKTISGIPNIKLHYVRHMMGNKLAKEILKKSTLKKGVSQAQAESWFKEAMKEVGKALAHTVGGKVTPLTAIKSYISPTLIIDYFASLGLRTPSFVPKV